MAFKFFDLVVQNYPPSFSLYAEKILQNYEDILRKNQCYLQDKGKLKSAFAGLVRCLSLLPCNKRSIETREKFDDRFFILNILIAEIFLQYSEWIFPPAVLLEKFLEFIEDALLGKICSDTRSGKAVWGKLVKQYGESMFFRCCLLFQNFYDKWRVIGSFVFSSPESSLKLACLSAIEEMLVPTDEMVCPDASDPLFEHQIIWIRALPVLLILLDDKHPSSSQIVLHLLHRLGQRACMNSSFAREYDNILYSLSKFYSSCQEGGEICYGPFVRLPRNSQELSICGLYYFSYLDKLSLKSIASFCLCPELEPFVLFRIIEVLHSSFNDGHILTAYHMSFFITLLSRFKVFPENIYPAVENDVKISNRGTFKSLTNAVCSCLSHMGDDSLVFQILEKVILDQLLSKPPLDNACAMLRMLVILDSKPTSLSEQSISTLSNYLSGYLIDVVHCIPEMMMTPMNLLAYKHPVITSCHAFSFLIGATSF
ncbi:hypothetical protein Ddye_027114 [Dipteronia dyeriana]|uniref:TEX10-like TPR repeats domain-containing protein n=1 Tax=Dipteronia dyeriana TaxID=168575 RepID=A0AAD9TPE1_9ROSI|nr:hypothetical protein Ddye_027114 [Dipteronia dyeriana]